MEAIGAKLIETLNIYKVDAQLIDTIQGPVVTQYKLSLAPGTRPETVESLQSTLMMNLILEAFEWSLPF